MVRYHPGSSQAAWEYKEPTNQEGKEKSLKGGRLWRWECSTSKGAAEEAAGEDCHLPSSSSARRARDGTSQRELSPSSAAKHVKIETAGGEWYALPRPALA